MKYLQEISEAYLNGQLSLSRFPKSYRSYVTKSNLYNYVNEPKYPPYSVQLPNLSSCYTLSRMWTRSEQLADITTLDYSYNIIQILFIRNS